MKTEQLIPVDHPSEFLTEELDARGWSRDRLAVEMGGDAPRNLLCIDMYYAVGPTNPHCRMGEDFAAQLEHAFGVSAQFFLNLERAWLDYMAKVALS